MSSAANRRVVVTGAGLISPLGNCPDALWNALVDGRSGVAELQTLPSRWLPTRYGAECSEFTGNIDEFGPLEKIAKRNIKKGLKVMCREIMMGVAAAQLAIHHSGLQPGSHDPDRTGVVYGSDHIMTVPDEFEAGVHKCLGADGEFEFARWAEEGMPQVTPLWLLKYLPNMPASHIAIYNDFRGANNSLTLREAAANLAVAEAFCTISRGSADRMIAGATGTRVHPVRSVHVILQEELATNGVPAEQLSRPFDRDRTGMVLGEGAGAVMLEELTMAEQRGASILAEVIGYGSSSVMEKNGVARCGTAIKNALVQAMRSASVTPDDIGHVHAHGLSTRKSDAEEAAGINQAMADRSSPVPIVAAKSHFGNLGAGGGLVELIASIMSLKNGHLFPVLNYANPDPDCNISVVQSNDRPAGNAFANVNVTPQGQASAVIVRRFEEGS